MSKFVHLHVHTEYSLLDGLSNVSSLMTHVKEKGMDAIAITDHGAMYGAIEFYKEGISRGVKPIIGMEAYTSKLPHTERSEKARQNFHLLLLAKNMEGYKNLMKITSIAHVEGYYYRPRIDRETLAKYSKGLIATSACPLGEIGQSLIKDEYREAKKTAEWFLGVFGKDYYLEIQRHNFEKWATLSDSTEIKNSLLEANANSKKVEEGVIKLSRELGIPLVATNDAHYIKEGDAAAQDALVCIATGRTISDIKRMRYIDTPDFYLKTPEEMSAEFSDYPEAIINTVKIAEVCNLEIVLGSWFFPKFDLPKGLTPDDQLRSLAKKRLKEKIPNHNKETTKRLDYELEIICKKGYSTYFLIMMDLANWAQEKGIITNTRGSAAGSLVSYVLGITTVNPLTYYLPFERFLNPSRPSPPDIDFDVADDRRDEIIKYLTNKYGKEKVAQVCTFGRMLSRASVRDVSRVLGYPYSTGDRIAKLIPPPKQGFPITITKALEEIPDLKSFYDSDPDTKKILDLAIQVEGNVRHVSVHAAGVVVAPTEITDFSPVQLEPSGDKVITQYEMHAAEDVGLIKFDILGIRNLSILGSAIKVVENARGIKVNISSIPLDDKKTFQMLSRGETMGTFQLGGGGMTKYIKDLKPNKVEDLMAMVALYRPGPLSQIPEYIRRKNNPKLVKYLDPRMEKFLGASYGLIVYQDDLLFCAIDLAGYSWEEADKFRKAVGKKIPSEMAAQRERFVKGIVDNGQTEDFAKELWRLFEPFQSYGFNKAHAASYGIVAYQTAYMKANYPVEYMTALLTAESSDTEKISAAINESKKMGIKVLPPDINESGVDFNIVEEKDSLGGKGIRFGLSAIKNVGKAAIEAILEARDKGKFTSFADFLSRADGRRVNKKVLESLIKVGALGSFGNRASLLASLDEVRNKVAKPVSKNESQRDLFGEEDIAKTKASGLLISIQTVEEFTEDELQGLERQLLGFSLSAKPASELIGPLEAGATHKIFEISGNDNFEEMVSIAAVITEVRVIITKKSGAEMAFAKGDDGTGVIDLVIFPKLFTLTRDFWVEGKPILLHGKIDVRQDTPSILVESIETLSDMGAKKEKEVFVKVPKDVDSTALKNLKSLLTQNPGSQVVYLSFEGGREIKLPFGISWSERLGRQILEILEGKDHFPVQ